MTNVEFAKKIKEVAEKYKTLYVMACFGAPLNETNKARYIAENDYNGKAARKALIEKASADTFGFDCVCLIKAILWGWCGDKNKQYGGATYQSNGVPDISADEIIKVCKSVSGDFSEIEIGELLWMSGHVGIYIGNGLAVEASPKWGNNVQITAANRTVAGYNRRDWKKHGKLPYVQYVKEEESKVTVELSTLKRGSKGEEVKTLQRILIGMGYNLNPYGGVDGSFGAKTEEYVKEFQRNRHLVIDGVVGKETWPALLKG